MRILISTHHEQSPDTGASGTGLALGRAYAELGHEVAYLSFDDLPDLPERALTLIYPSFVAARLLRRHREFDVIDASTGDSWIWASLPRPAGAPALVTRSHGLEHLFNEHTHEHARRNGERISLRHRLYWGGWRQFEVGRSLRRADLVLALNERERTYETEQLAVDPERIEIVPNGIDDALMAAAAEVNPETGSRRIAYVGDYREMKGVRYASEAMVAVMRAEPEALVSFIGPRVPRAQVLERFPADLHDRVTTIESYERLNLPHLLEGYGIVLFPSLSEGFGNALAESMACGLAPVAARSAGAEQIVADDVNGLLVPRYDATALAAKTLELLRDPELLARLQAEARRSTRGYAMRAVAARTLDLYQQAIERRR